MLRNSLKRWISSKFSTSWQLMLVLAGNYILNGQLFAAVYPVTGGPPGFVFDIYNSVSICLVLLLFRLFGPRASYKNSWIAWVSASSLANLLPILIVPFLFPEVDVETESFRNFALMAVIGFVQMIVVQVLFTVLIASYSEARAARKTLAIQRAKLSFLQHQLGSQLSEIKNRLRLDVLEKLEQLLFSLSDQFKNKVHPQQLALKVAETLNSGVRPLSWQIEAVNNGPDDFASAKPLKSSMRERFNFKLNIGEASSPTSVVALMVTFDVPLIYFVFGLESAFQGLLSICVIFITLFLYRRLFGTAQVLSFVVVLAATAIAAISGSTFLLIRHLTQQLTPDLAELGVVISFAQIALAVTWFEVIVKRREVSLRLGQSANEQLEILVSKLRQNVWLEKSRLAKLVHGPVQSKLFAVYLDLIRRKELDQEQANALAERIRSANEDLKLEGTSANVSIEDAVNSIASGWGDTLSFEIEVTPEAALALNSELVAKACCAEVLREAVNNAAKHGDGGVINIRLRQSNSELIEIQIANSVSNSNDDVAPGYGTRVLGEVTHNWNIKFIDGRAVFTALVALKPAP
jgi:signal transduction histidine kinase